MTEKKTNKDIISERSDMAGLKSTVSKNIPMDISQNSLLLSSEIGKKSSDKKNNDIKQSNLMAERSINKKNRKQIENDSFHTYDTFDNDFSQKKKTTKKKEEKKKTVTKILVDDIENIYSTLIDKTNNKYYYQKNFILLIAFFVNICRWLFLFITKEKLENNYCFSKLNQFDNCIPDQICNNDDKLNIQLYIFTFNVVNTIFF